MAKCPKCGANNPEGDNFCAKCGSRTSMPALPAPVAVAPGFHLNKLLVLVIIAAVAVIIAIFLLTQQQLPMTDENIRAGHPVVCQLPEAVANGSIIIIKISYPRYRFEMSDPELPGMGLIMVQSASGRGYVYSPSEFGNFWWEASAGYSESLRWLFTPDKAIVSALHSQDENLKHIDMGCSFVSSIPDSEFEPPRGVSIRPYSEDVMGEMQAP